MWCCRFIGGKEVIYLSLDLDFFNVEQTLSLNLLTKIANSGLPTKVVVSHEQLVSHINKFVGKFDTLVNVDYHSDFPTITDLKSLDFDEGTWGAFVKRSTEKTFIWSPPSRKSLSYFTGYCHGYYPNPFTKSNRKKVELTGWQDAQIKLKYIPKLNECIAIGICLSPWWTHYTILNDFSKWFRQYKPQFNLGHGVKKYV